MSSLTDAIKARQQRDATFEANRQLILAEMIKIGGAVEVSGRPLYVWVRELDQNGGVFQVFNPNVQARAGTPVIIGYGPKPPYRLQVLRVDWSILSGLDDFDGDPMLATHGHAHEWPDGLPGGDVVDVHPRALVPLRTYPGTGLQVNVMPLRYSYNGAAVQFLGQYEYDISGSQPASGSVRYVLIYLNMTTNALGTVNGTAVGYGPTVTPPYPNIPAQAIPSAFIQLDGDQTSITETDIEDARMPLGDTGWRTWGHVWVVASSGGDFSTIPAAVADSSVVDGDILLLAPGTHAGWSTTKNLAYISLTPYNYAAGSCEVDVTTAVTLNDPSGGRSTFRGIKFTGGLIVDYNPDIYFQFCAFTTVGITDGVNSSPGFLVFDHCYLWVTNAVDLTNGSGLDVRFRDSHVAGNIDVGTNTLVLISHYQQPATTITAGSIVRDDAPHIQTASYGVNALIVGHEGAQYSDVLGAIAAVTTGETIFVLVDTWTSNDEDLPASTRLVGHDKDGTILSTTSAATVITMADGTYIANVTLENTSNDAAARAALKFEVTTNEAEAQNVIAVCDNDTGAGYGIWVSGSNAIIWLKECDGFSIGTSASVYGLYVDGADDAVYVRGGRYYGIDADICVNNASATIVLIGPVLENGTITVTAGTVTGWWVDTNGDIHDIGTLKANQLQSLVATGTAPLIVASTTKVANLNADLLDDYTQAAVSTPSTIARRDAAGDLVADNFKLDDDPDVSTGLTKILAETGNDGYIRHANFAAMQEFLASALQQLAYDTSAAITTLGSSYATITEFSFTVPTGMTYDVCLFGLLTVWGNTARNQVALARFYRDANALLPEPAVGGGANDRLSFMVMAVDANRSAGTYTYYLKARKTNAADTVTIGGVVPTFAIGIRR
jgi:hypothetical protein